MFSTSTQPTFPGSSQDKNREMLTAVAVASLFALREIFIWDYGFNPDEGLEFSSILNIIDGKTVYKDFVWIYGPFGLYFYYALYKVFGLAGVEVLKINVAVFGTLGCFFAYKSARAILSPLWAGIAALLAFSSLVAPTHVSSHIFSIFSAMICLYFTLSYVNERRMHFLAIAGLACGVSLLTKPIHYGGAAVIGSVATIFIHDFFFEKDKLKNSLLFLCFAAALPAAVYAFMLAFIPPKKLFFNLFPMFSGYFNKPSSFFYAKDLLPYGIIDAGSFAQVKAILNTYIGDSLRWWLIWIMAFFGSARVLRLWLQERKVSREQIVLFSLVINSILLEFQVLTVPHLFSSFINMLPTYILLCYFAGRAAINPLWKGLSISFIAFWFCIFCIYSPLKYYLHFKDNGVPFARNYAQKLVVTPYQKKIYADAEQFIWQKTSRDQKILVADFDPFIYVFSGRKSLFPEDDIVFLKTYFFPYNWGQSRLGYTDNHFTDSENAIIDRVKSDLPALILIPAKYIRADRIEGSLFLQYVQNNWEAIAEIGDEKLIGPFDNNKNITVFEKKSRPQ